MIQTKLKVSPVEATTVDAQLAIPVSIPEMEEIRQLANQLHKNGVVYEGEYAGWPVQYDPEFAEPPLDSRLPFTPAFFWIGVWPVWYVSFTWESGCDQDPSILTGDENLVKQVEG